MTNGNKGTPIADIRFWLISFPSIQNMMTVAHSITSWLYTLYYLSASYYILYTLYLQMAQLSTTMSQAHRATAFHFLTSNLNRMIEQWQKSISCISDYNPKIPFLILPRNNARTTWLLRVAVNLHLAIGIYTKSESGSLSFHDFYLSQSVEVFQCKLSTRAMSFVTLCFIS